jgi:serine/threonine protein kinase
LEKGKLSIKDTMLYGGQIAAALAEAHSKGITHRDLKPDNVMMTNSGIKVLDFGLAKVEGEGGTKSNVIMGTPAYMAPEQLEGKEADARADIYALGLVLVEMATGKRSRDAKALPRQVAHIVERCLALEPANRWQTASDIRAELEWAARIQPAPPASRPNGRWRWIAATTLLFIAILTAWAILRYREPRSADGLAYRLEIQPPENGRFVITGVDGGFALSSDGKSVAYAAAQNGKTGLWIRPLEGSTARPLPGTERASSLSGLRTASP